MPKQIKKTQHYIPQLILEGFLNEKQQIIEMFIPEKRIYPTDPGNAMAENYTYEHSEIEPNSIEDLFWKIEDIVAPEIKNLRNDVKKVDSGGMDIFCFKEKVENLYKFFILSYYRSGALLTEYSTFKKDDKIPLLTQKILDSRYIEQLSETIKHGYDFAILKSDNNFLLSDQGVSTVALRVKSRFPDVSNRNIGLQETLILIPISSSYYIALWNSKYGFGVEPNIVHPVDDKLLYLINRSILNNSYIKCVAQKVERLHDVQNDFDFRSPSQIFGGGNPKGYSMGATLKKEVFFTEVEAKADELLHFLLFERYKNVGVNKSCPCGETKADGTPKKYKKCHKESYERARIIIQTFNGPYPFADWRPFMIPSIPVIEYPIDKWAGFSNVQEATLN